MWITQKEMKFVLGKVHLLRQEEGGGGGGG